ncbi:MAG: DUF5615 family PIN-like protein [Bacteroidales bacterium]|nr:DUF5615 family PIN-like protein [Bacteroidales bacterium]
MIIADENIDKRIINELRNEHFEVYSIFERNRGLKDEDIIQIAKELQYFILTEDKDFGEWVFAHNEKEIGVILLRYHFSETNQIINILKGLLIKKAEILLNKFTTVTRNKIRIRDL